MLNKKGGSWTVCASRSLPTWGDVDQVSPPPPPFPPILRHLPSPAEPVAQPSSRAEPLRIFDFGILVSGPIGWAGGEVDLLGGVPAAVCGTARTTTGSRPHTGAGGNPARRAPVVREQVRDRGAAPRRRGAKTCRRGPGGDGAHGVGADAGGDSDWPMIFTGALTGCQPTPWIQRSGVWRRRRAAWPDTGPVTRMAVRRYRAHFPGEPQRHHSPVICARHFMIVVCADRAGVGSLDPWD